MNLFGKAKKKPSPNETIQRLRDTLDLLEKREKYLQKKADIELIEAKKNAQKNKRAAIFSLKKKKVYEGQIEKLAGARMTIETQILHLEQTTVTKDALEAMKAGADTMKDIHGHMSIEDVENTMEDIREQMDIANEITEAISQPVGFGADIDEDELNAELEELTQQDLDSKLLGVDDGGKMPSVSVPSVAVPGHSEAVQQPQAEGADDAEFRKLAEEMSFA